MDPKTKRIRDAFIVWLLSLAGLAALLGWCAMMHALEIWP